MRRWRRGILIALLAVAVIGAGAWYWQSQIIGHGTRWYLARVAVGEEARGDLTQRRQAVARVHRMLLLGPAGDPFVPELFDLLTALSSRVASGEISWSWSAYVYTSYLRDLVRDRPEARPRRTHAEIETELGEYVRFYTLQKRPDVPGLGVRDLAGANDGESFTLDDIRRAAKEGKDLTRRE
jgi:hypothetical protein